MFELFYWIEEIVTNTRALVSLDLDKRVKSNDRLKYMDKSVKKVITNRTPAEIKTEKGKY